MKKKILGLVLYVFAFLMLFYFVILMVTIGPGFRFNYVWLLGGLFFLGVALIISFSKKGFDFLPKPLLYLMEILVLTGCLLFIFVEGLIIRQSLRVPTEEADYLIVLGAKVNGTTPSKILKYRIEKAAEYLEAHADTKVIVSGGKGADEGISEAEAMYNGLLECGIAKERIILESQSTSTKENLDFSKSLLEEKGVNLNEQNILVVTTDFHVLRAVQIAEKTGFHNVEGLAAKSVWYLIPTNYVREFLAVVKDKLMGNM